MIGAMRELALLELNHRFGCRGASMERLREMHPEKIAPLLVEASEKVPRVYLLQALPNQPGSVRMWVEELDNARRRRLPFNKPTGAQSGAIGPVFKRSYKPKATPPYGPTSRIQKTTARDFAARAESSHEWADYFCEICDTLFHGSVLLFEEATFPVGPGQKDPDVLAAALRLIPEKETVFLSVLDSEGRWPGDRPEYHAYLAHALASIKYVTGASPPRDEADCPLCGASSITLYANGLKGAGINFGNLDRAGAFPDLDPGQAWKAYGLCLDCADLLYIFKNHLLGSFIGRVAGEKALLLPALLGNEEGRHLFMRDWHDYIRHLESKAGSIEKDLMEFFAGRDDAHVVLHVLWATFGQLVEKVSGTITDILPSRLQALGRLNKRAGRWSHPLAPKSRPQNSDFDLPLSVLRGLFHRPGGARAKQSNRSARLFALKRQLASALYHGLPLGDARAQLDDEWLTTARWYVDDALISDNSWGLLHEGIPRKQGKSDDFWTLAGWVRHLARFFYYLDITEVLLMESDQLAFEPEMDKLKPYFLPGSGLDTREKAFAFLLGILYGKLLQVQSARGVNVGANALTWLKRLHLSGRDLPELYNKIREKLLAYGVEASADVRAVLHELGRLGSELGDTIVLNETSTCYFLLLGQSITVDVLPSRQAEGGDEK